MAVTQRLSEFSAARVLAPPNSFSDQYAIPDDLGRCVSAAEADEVARKCLTVLIGADTLTLVVEDDLANRDDPNLDMAAFIGPRVIRWHEARGMMGDAVALLRRGASGYPLNAFLCRGAPDDLALSEGHELSVAETDTLALAATGVIVSVWDAEAYVLVVTPDVEARITGYPISDGDSL